MNLYMDGTLSLTNQHVSMLIPPKVLDKGLLYVGGARSGKTSAILQLADQIDAVGDHVTKVYFDTRRDYLRRYYRPGDIILSLYPEPGYPISESWSLMAEAKADLNSPEDSLKELCNMLYEEQIRNSNQQFFPKSGRDIFEAVLLTMMRNCGSYTMPNKDMIETIKSMTAEDYLYRLSLYPDLIGLSSVIPHTPGDPVIAQTAGVLAEISDMVRNTFVGQYAGTGRLSVREFLRNPKGRSMFILFQYGNKEASRPINRIMLDMVIKECLAGMAQKKVILYLDEWPLVPKLSYLRDGLSFGAGTGAGLNIICGCQNVSQVLDNYSEYGGKALLEGFGSIVAFHPNQKPTRDFIKDFFGSRYESGGSYGDVFSADRRGKAAPGIHEFPAVKDETLYRLITGEAVIGFVGTSPVSFQFDLPTARE